MLEALSAFFAQYGNLLREGTIDTLIMVSVTTVFAYLLGLPLGVLLNITNLTASGPIRGSTVWWAGSPIWADRCPS